MDRMLQVNSMLQKALGEIISQKLETPFDLLITVSLVKCGADLKTASVFVSILPFNKSKEGLAFLINHRHEIRGLLGKHIHLKFTPTLTFKIDDREEFTDDMYSKLDEISEK